MMAIKQLHIALISVSVLGFLVRSVWLFMQHPMLQKSFVRVFPHVIDTLLFASGVTLVVISKQYPTTASWLAIKLGLIVLYIAAGAKMFRATTSLSKTRWFLLGVASLILIISLALNKPVFW